MKPVLIVENNANPLSINENNSSAKKSYLLEGIFTEFDVVNRNQRVYTADKFIPCLDEMNERINTMGVVYGEFDHPDVFDTSLSRASHLIQKATYVKEQNRVEGQIKLLTTYWGKEARSLVDDGCPIFVSSRAAGITEADGSVSLKKLFTYDIVADPGFASAKMSSINESLGFNEAKSNFRIYDLSNESKTNELFEMNRNDLVTKEQLSQYSKYLINEISTTRSMVRNAVNEGKMEPAQLEKLLEYYDELNNTNNQIVKYLDYLAESVQVMVNENKSLKETTNKLISHNDYLAENLEKAVNYTEYLAENLDKNISYSEYIAENLDKNIAYSEYIAENLDKNIAYSEYIAENLDKNISYSEYLAENLDNNIAYSEYIAENLEGNIAYAEYIAEHLDDNIAYAEYIAENVDKTISYAGMIAEKLNEGNSVNESVNIPSLKDSGFEVMDAVTTTVQINENFNAYEEEEEAETNEVEAETNEVEATNDDNVIIEEPVSTEVVMDNKEEDCEDCGTLKAYESDSDLSLKIDQLIEEAKKRKVSETNDVHFLKFLNKTQVDSYYNLTNEEQEEVKLYVSERSYFTSQDVLKLIQEALSVKNESLEERLIRLMPDNVKPIWEQLNETSKKSILAQGKLYSNLNTETEVEHFWSTRQLKKNESVSKKLVSHDSILQEDKLSDSDMKSIMERFRNI